MSLTFKFRPVEPKEKTQLEQWLQQDHIKEWLHGQGLKNTFNDLDKFFLGVSYCQHWFGTINGIPFAYLITSFINNDEERFLNLIPKNAKAISLDVFICELTYLGKRLAADMIKQFLRSKFPSIDAVFIDPEATNKRAIHVYEKVGFQFVKEFIAPWHPVPHHMMLLKTHLT